MCYKKFSQPIVDALNSGATGALGLPRHSKGETVMAATTHRQAQKEPLTVSGI